VERNYLVLQRGALSGDGYKGAEKQRSSPHTAYEMFEGLTIKRAAEVGVTIGVVCWWIHLIRNAFFTNSVMLSFYLTFSWCQHSLPVVFDRI